MVWRERVTHEQNQHPPFTVPVSSVPYHFSTSPSSLTTTPPPSPLQLTATYITLTNQRLRGFFFFSFASHLPVTSTSPLSAVPFQQGALLKKKMTANPSTPHLSVTCCLFRSSLVSALSLFYILCLFLHPL